MPALNSKEAPTPSVLPASTSGAASAALSITMSACTTRSVSAPSVSVTPLPMKAVLRPSASVALKAPATPAIWMPVPETALASSVCVPSPEAAVATVMPLACALPEIDATRSDCCALTATPPAAPTRLSTALALARAFASTSLVARTLSAPPVDVAVPVAVISAVAAALARFAPTAAALPCVWLPASASRLPVSTPGSVTGGRGAVPKTRLARLERKVISSPTRPVAEVVAASAPCAPATPSAWFCTRASAPMVMPPTAVTVPATLTSAASLARFTAIGRASDCVGPAACAAAALLLARTMLVARWLACAAKLPPTLSTAPAPTKALLALAVTEAAIVIAEASKPATAPASAVTRVVWSPLAVSARSSAPVIAAPASMEAIVL